MRIASGCSAPSMEVLAERPLNLVWLLRNQTLKSGPGFLPKVGHIQHGSRFYLRDALLTNLQRSAGAWPPTKEGSVDRSQLAQTRDRSVSAVLNAEWTVTTTTASMIETDRLILKTPTPITTTGSEYLQRCLDLGSRSLGCRSSRPGSCSPSSNREDHRRRLRRSHLHQDRVTRGVL